MPVDLYVGGAEHAVLHLLYSRFWHKVLFDLGHVSTPEPFRRLVNQGIILGRSGVTHTAGARRAKRKVRTRREKVRLIHDEKQRKDGAYEAGRAPTLVREGRHAQSFKMSKAAGSRKPGRYRRRITARIRFGFMRT